MAALWFLLMFSGQLISYVSNMKGVTSGAETALILPVHQR